jgi:homocysteine S-methyltransferase
VLSVLQEYPNAKAWVSFSCRDDKFTAHGEDVAVAAGQAVSVGQGQLMGVGVNCCRPGDVTRLLSRMRTAVLPEIGLVAYPNSGEVYEPQSGKFFGTVADFSGYVGQWAAIGANLIGGCCRVYPEDISRMRAALKLG